MSSPAFQLCRFRGALGINGMAIHAERQFSKESIDCGLSFTQLGRPSRYGAEALAASVLAIGNRRVPVWRSPPEQAGLILRGGFRRRSKSE